MFGNNSFGNTSFGSTTFGAGGFGSTPTLGTFGATQQQQPQSVGPIGTTIRFVPLNGTDTVPKTGTNPGGPTQITTRHQNISAMKEYETKSNDELRLEDYTANRKVGQPQTAFGSTPFNSMQPSTSQQSTSIFGASTQQKPSLFGTPQPSTSSLGNLFNTQPKMFGTPTAPASTGFLGQTSNLASQTQSPFGQTNTGSIFGSSPAQNQPSLFGTTAAVPTSTTQPFSFPSSGAQPQTSSIFNTSLNNDANKSAFSMPSTSSLFNFGASSSGNTLTLNTSTTTASIFGNTTTTTASNMGPFSSMNNNLSFGSQNTSTSLFGTNSMQPNQTNPLQGTNELTFDPNRKVGQAPSAFGATPFNSIQPSTSQQNTSIFGSTTQQTPSLFGPAQPANQSMGNIFNTQPKMFGTPTAPASTGFLGQTSNLTSQTQSPFGQANTGSIFGSTATQTQPSLFGSTAAASTTGTQPFSFPSTNNQPQNSSIFNTSLSTDANKSAFSVPGSNSLFNFGASSSGSTLAPNTNTTATSIFGNTTATTTSNMGPFSSMNNNLSFGSQNASTSLFGSNSLQTNPTNPLQQANLSANINNQTSPQSPDLLLNRLKTLPYGETSLFLNDSGSNAGLGSIKFTTDQKTINQYKMSAKTNVKLNKPSSNEKNQANSVLFDGLDENINDDLRCAIDVFVPKKSIKKLDLDLNSHLSEGDAEHVTESPAFERTRSSLASSRSMRENTIDGERRTSNRHVRYADNTFPGGHSDTNDTFSANPTSASSNESDISSFHNASHNRSQSTHSSFEASGYSTRNLSGSKSGLVSTRPDYKLKPSIEEIDRRYNPETESCFVDSFIIERPNYGSIQFVSVASPMDLKGINLDKIVHIRRKEVIVYPDDENKPPVGQGLNRPAIVTLHQVWPVDKSSNELIKDPDRLNSMRYPEKIESATIEKGAVFIEYRPETGTWIFAVKHFSKYGITDDDEDLDHVTIPSHQPVSLQVPQQNPVRVTHERVATNIYKMSPKINMNLNKSLTQDESKLSTSVLFESMDDSLNCSMRPAIDELFEDEDETDAKNKELRRSLTVHGTKRLALQNISPNISVLSTEKPFVVGSAVPKQLNVREIKLKPDLFAAKNQLTRDIMSVCVSGAPKVRFMNGSRQFCLIRDDSVIVHELHLVPTANGKIKPELSDKFEEFLSKNSIITSLNMSPTLAPYIETDDFIPNSSSRELLHALYGNLTSKTPYAKQDERMNRVINWLASVNRKLTPPTNFYQLIIYHMSCDRYDIASSLAIENDHPRLALLISTLNLDKNLMFNQLSSWGLGKADQYIDTDLLKIYILLAGETEWKLSNDKIIHCLDGLKWTQQLCLLALHMTSFSPDQDKYGFYLLPSYIKRLSTDTDDVDYHIIARHSAANILSAATNLVEEWFLLESLKSFRVINSEFESVNSDVIHCNLASQLCSIDLAWACFVALHIVSNEVRNQVLIRCLEQNYDQLKNEINDPDKPSATITVEAWLMKRLQVPAEFIRRAKCLAPR